MDGTYKKEVMNIKNIKNALSLFEKHEIKRGEALNVGNSSKANYHYDKIREITGFLKRENALSDLSIFLKHPNPYVVLGAAVNLLPWDEKKSLEVLKFIENNEKGIISIEAEYSIKEWENGNLKKYYTLQ